MIADVVKWNRVGTSTAALGLNPLGGLVQFLGNVFDGQEGLEETRTLEMLAQSSQQSRARMHRQARNSSFGR